LATQAWAGFGYYTPITINHPKVPSTQTDFPVLISVTDARFKDVAHGGPVQSIHGYDIHPKVAADLIANYTYELERYNPATGEVIMWVKIPSLSSSSDTTIYMAYCNALITTDLSSKNTWSNNFLGVYHLKDGTTLDVSNSGGVPNGTNSGATATTGKIDGGAGFVSASSQYINIGNDFNPTAITISAWINATSLPNAYNNVMS
jgi:hypothetical protein